MILNPVIMGAIVVQSGISKVSKIAGAVTSYIITTGILVWGLSAYADGNMIALFGISLSQSVFIKACCIWYVFDTCQFMAVLKRPVDDTAENSVSDTRKNNSFQI